MKIFKGKAIYNPSGKAGEYSYWACNFYNGCSNGCTYCYCKKGVLANVLGGDVPTLKKCFKDEENALTVFIHEALDNINELKKHGIFFSFTTDPMLKETYELTYKAITWCASFGIPVKILTKVSQWVDSFLLEIENNYVLYNHKKNIAFGFTLTGHDELEWGASANVIRICDMRTLYNEGFKTFASIEPIIDFQSSLDMIKQSNDFCDLYKIGLMSGKKYDKHELRLFMDMCQQNIKGKIYFKDSLLKVAGVERFELPTNCVTRDYNLFV